LRKRHPVWGLGALIPSVLTPGRVSPGRSRLPPIQNDGRVVDDTSHSRRDANFWEESLPSSDRPLSLGERTLGIPLVGGFQAFWAPLMTWAIIVLVAGWVSMHVVRLAGTMMSFPSNSTPKVIGFHPLFNGCSHVANPIWRWIRHGPQKLCPYPVDHHPRLGCLCIHVASPRWVAARGDSRLSRSGSKIARGECIRRGGSAPNTSWSSRFEPS